MRESAIEKKIVTFARQQGCLTFKFTSPGQKGVPDRCFISPHGNVLFLEIKAPGKKPTPLQFRVIEKLREQMTAAWWVYDAVKGIQMVADFLQHPRTFNERYT